MGDADPVHAHAGALGAKTCKVRVSALDPGGGKRFSASTTTDLILSVLLPGKPTGTRVVKVRVFTPRGHLYQSLAAPVTAKGGEQVKIPGYPRSVKAVAPREVRVGNQRHFAADLRLPVAGTVIATTSLYGLWRAEAHLDGSTAPCGKSTTFEIVE